MHITDQSAVTFHYTLCNDAGEILDSSIDQAPLAYIHGLGNIIPGLETALTGKQAGDKLTVTIAPEDGYGLVDEAMRQIVSKQMFQGMDIEVGMQFHAEVSHGPGIITITSIDGEEVTVDGNHPLAGVALTFDVEILDVRAASADELAHGHIHGESCQH